MTKHFLAWCEVERGRFFLWIPVCLGAGMALYYALPFEPGRVLYAAPLALMFVWAVRQRVGVALAMLLLALALAATGASYAKFRTGRIEAQALERPLPITAITGTISELEWKDKAVRITLEKVSATERNDKLPERIRVSFRAKTMPELRPGMRVDLRAALMPPSGPVIPGAFDFSRHFFFKEIGAVGYAIPPIRVREELSQRGVHAFWRDARDRLTASIRATLPGAEGAIAAGMITGDDAAIPEPVYEELRAANLVHIIAISGTHMVVIGGIVFVGLRGLLVLIPGAGQRPVIKSITAALTLLAITLYLAITAFEVSAFRAYVMLALVLLAIIVQREPRPMRSIALAALLMLLIEPSDVMSPGFQLSFGATLALIAAFEAPYQRWIGEVSWWRRAWQLVAAAFLTSLVAQAATTPFIIFNFNSFTTYGLFANLVLTPVVTALLMPMVALYFLLLPLGLESFALQIMAYGIRAMLWVAHEVSGWPYALLYLPSLSEAGMALSAFGLCWICLWRTRLRHLGVVMLLAGTATFLLYRAPDMLISPRAAQVAARTQNGMVLLRGRPEGMFAELWANALGQKALPEYRALAPLKDAECGKGYCRLQAGREKLHFSFTVPDIKKGCPKEGWWISGYYFFKNERAACAKSVQFIDRDDFDKNGSYWGFYGKDGIVWGTTRELQGERPWSR